MSDSTQKKKGGCFKKFIIISVIFFTVMVLFVNLVVGPQKAKEWEENKARLMPLAQTAFEMGEYEKATDLLQPYRYVEDTEMLDLFTKADNALHQKRTAEAQAKAAAIEAAKTPVDRVKEALGKNRKVISVEMIDEEKKIVEVVYAWDVVFKANARELMRDALPIAKAVAKSGQAETVLVTPMAEITDDLGNKSRKAFGHLSLSSELIKKTKWKNLLPEQKFNVFKKYGRAVIKMRMDK